MHAHWLGALAALALAAAAGGCGCASDEEGAGDGRLSGSIFVYCAGGVKRPVTELARAFEKETGVKVELTYANSGMLLGQLATTRTGDVYVPGDVGYIEQAADRGLARGEPRRLAYFIPVLLVRRGNPKGVRALGDLAKPGLRVALAAESAAVAKATKELFERNGIDEAAVRRNVVATPATVNDLALAVKLGSADAAVVWDAFGSLHPNETEPVAIPRERNVVRVVTATALASAKNPEAAAAFVEYLASERGRAVLRRHRFTVEAPE